MRTFNLTIGLGLFVSALAGCSSDSVSSLSVGECLNVSNLGTEVAEAPTVKCSTEHEAEVIAVFDLDLDLPKYDEQAITKAVDERCMNEFSKYVGLDYLNSTLDLGYFIPIEARWSAGDRQVICYVGLAEGKITETVKGSAK